MKIVVIQSYPTYHSGREIEEWLQLENREKWLPGILTSLGHDVEYWVGAKESGDYEFTDKDLPSYKIRYFTTSQRHKKSKYHESNALLSYAKSKNVDHYIIKGVDGGIGIHLLNNHLLKKNIPFSFIIGGKYYSKHVSKARYVFYETEYQRNKLINPGIKHLLRKKCRPEQLLPLPKSVDTTVFMPLTNQDKKWDIISVGRLIPNYKNFDDVCDLSDDYDIAIIGDGPHRQTLEKKYPKANFLGFKSNESLPKYLNRARLFFYSGERDYNPRVITEGMACGVPVAAYKSIIRPDVIPYNCGYLISKNNARDSIQSIFKNETQLIDKGKSAREFIEQNRSKFSTRKILEKTYPMNKNK